MLWHAKMSEYRKVLDRGMTAVRKSLIDGSCDPSDAAAAFCEYRTIYGIIDSMTPAERENPVETIDSERMRRISRGAGVTDRAVVQFLISYHDYNEQVLRAELRIFD